MYSLIRIIATVLACLLFALASLSSFAKSPVWKVSKDGNHLYLGGTIHLLSSSDYPLPKAFDSSFINADTLVFETDIRAAASPEVQQKFITMMTYKDGRTIKDELDADVYNELETFLAARNIPIVNFAKFTPAGISLTLTVLELQRLGLSNTAGVDSYYTLRALDENKKIEALESIDEQIGFIASLNAEDGNEIIRSTLRDTGNLEKIWKDMLDAWRSGDMQALERVALKPMQTEFPDMYQLMLVNRNNNWLKKLPAMFADPDIEYVLVGSLHMVGKDGLLQRLESAGYRIEQLD